MCRRARWGYGPLWHCSFARRCCCCRTGELAWVHRNPIYFVLLCVANTAELHPLGRRATATVIGWLDSSGARKHTDTPSAQRTNADERVTFRRSRSFILCTEITGLLKQPPLPRPFRSIPICIFKIILSMKIELMLSAATAAARRLAGE